MRHLLVTIQVTIQVTMQLHLPEISSVTMPVVSLETTLVTL